MSLGKVGLRHLNFAEDNTTTSKPLIALANLVEKGADTDLLRDMIQYVAQRLMGLDTEGLCAAAYGQRSPERANSRNGYRQRLWETRAGAVDLKIPKLRNVSLAPLARRAARVTPRPG